MRASHKVAIKNRFSLCLKLKYLLHSLKTETAECRSSAEGQEHTESVMMTMRRWRFAPDCRVIQVLTAWQEWVRRSSLLSAACFQEPLKFSKSANHITYGFVGPAGWAGCWRPSSVRPVGKTPAFASNDLLPLYASPDARPEGEILQRAKMWGVVIKIGHKFVPSTDFKVQGVAQENWILMAKNFRDCACTWSENQIVDSTDCVFAEYLSQFCCKLTIGHYFTPPSRSITEQQHTKTCSRTGAFNTTGIGGRSVLMPLERPIKHTSESKKRVVQ